MPVEVVMAPRSGAGLRAARATSPARPIVAMRFDGIALGYPRLVPRQLTLDETAAPLVPDKPSIAKLKEAAAGCTACPLHETGTQTVFGEGTSKAEVMFVGEQPGDQEDLQGKPFVGPAGKLLDKALEE